MTCSKPTKAGLYLCQYKDCFPQVMEIRAVPEEKMRLKVVVGDPYEWDGWLDKVFNEDYKWSEIIEID